ncbi:MAG TPA: hypothetical protein PKA41_09030 [Verrucomicrobiota bacterium]|nr:hypothetical protein [Verrucomicrobiota bacterium]
MKTFVIRPRFNTLIPLVLAAAIAISTALSALSQTVIVESKLADGSDNPAWTFTSGKWGRSKNKSRQSETSLTATNVATCNTTNDIPSFKISPELKSGTTYTLEVTFGTSNTQGASPALVVAVAAEGVSDSTIPETTKAFQAENANQWATVGKFTASTDKPAFTFTYAGGTISTNPIARWYADAVRFVPAAPKADE